MSSYYFVGQSFAGPFIGTTGTFSGNVTIGGTLAVTGASALAAVSATTGAFSGAVTLSNTAPTFNSTAPTTYLQTLQNNGTAVARVDKGGYLVPAIANPSTYYFAYDFDVATGTTNFTQNGNVAIGGINAVSAPLMAASNMGVGYANTSSTTAGGYLSLLGYPVIASATINYQWRILFYHPAASTAANTYTSHIGACSFTGTANNTLAGAFAGPHITYSHGLNSGNWVLASSVGGTRTTTNSAVSAAAALGAWNNLLITLANGTYTYTLNNVLLGTLADANILTTVANNQSTSPCGAAIVPDGTNFTTNRVLMIDRCDYWVTGLSR